jgi:hypothetical protein
MLESFAWRHARLPLLSAALAAAFGSGRTRTPLCISGYLWVKGRVRLM